jgi:hypothetical protein
MRLSFDGENVDITRGDVVCAGCAVFGFLVAVIALV